MRRVEISEKKWNRGTRTKSWRKKQRKKEWNEERERERKEQILEQNGIVGREKNLGERKKERKRKRKTETGKEKGRNFGNAHCRCLQFPVFSTDNLAWISFLIHLLDLRLKQRRLQSKQWDYLKCVAHIRFQKHIHMHPTHTYTHIFPGKIHTYLYIYEFVKKKKKRKTQCCNIGYVGKKRKKRENRLAKQFLCLMVYQLSWVI